MTKSKGNCQPRFIAKSSIIILFLYLSLISLAAEEIREPDIRLTGEIDASPLFFNTEYGLSGFEGATFWGAGFQKKNISRGFELFGEYMFLKNEETAPSHLSGHMVNTGALYNTFYNIPEVWRLKWGAGCYWQWRSYMINTVLLPDNNLGTLFLLEADVDLWKYFNLEIKNRLDIIYTFNPVITNISMNYTGKIRLNYRPGPDWLNIFLEGTAFFWGFSSQEEEWNSFSVKLGTGLAMDKIVYYGKILTTEPVTPEPPEVIPEPPEIIPEIPIEELYPELLKLRNGLPGDQIGFPGIQFVIGQADIQPQSHAVLDGILIILQENKGMVIRISAFAPFTGDPEYDNIFYKVRSDQVARYFTERGIAKERLQISMKNSRVFPGEPLNDPEDPPVIIEILTKSLNSLK